MKRYLDKIIDLVQVRKILDVGRQLDINKGGYFDSRLGCVNIWCGPEDKPDCWDAEIYPGALKFPRAFCGTLGWEWKGNGAKLYLCCQPYELDSPDWDSLFEWLIEKSNFLLEMTKEKEI